MSKNYKFIEYNNTFDDIEIGDYIKISIHFEICFDMSTSSIITNTTEHIWTYVTNISQEKISVLVSNHMFYKPIDFPDLLNKDNIIIIKKSNIKELKRYTVETRQKTVDELLKIINHLPLEYKNLLETLNKTECEEVFEQLLNTKKII